MPRFQRGAESTMLRRPIQRCIDYIRQSTSKC
jgi:hypothetical protein